MINYASASARISPENDFKSREQARQYDGPVPSFWVVLLFSLIVWITGEVVVFAYHHGANAEKYVQGAVFFVMFAMWYLYVPGVLVCLAISQVLTRFFRAGRMRRLARFLAWPWTAPAALVLVALVLFLWNINISTLLEQARQQQAKKAEKTEWVPIKGPVDFVFLNGVKIEDFHNQYAQELRLAAMEQQASSKATGSVGLDIAALDSRASGEISSVTTARYEPTAKGIGRKAIDLINYMAHKQVLKRVETIAEISDKYRELSGIEKTLHDKYNVVISSAQLRTVYASVIFEELRSGIRQRFAPNLWVLVSGRFAISAEQNERLLRFDFIPQVSGRVVLDAVVARSELKCSQTTTKGGTEINATLFGKIADLSGDTEGYRVSVIPYAIFR